MPNNDIWNAAAAAAYDTPGVGIFAADLLAATVARLQGLAADGAALEFAIGTGRVAIPLWAAGVPVSGIELSPAMVAELRGKARDSIPVLIGDMASVQVPGAFTLVYLVFNTISNLLTQAGQIACFRNAARHLTPGGCFVIELWVPQLPLPPPEPQAVAVRAGAGYLLVDVFDVAAQGVVSHHVRFDADAAAQLFRSPHRYVWPAELDLMAQLAGFTLESRAADWVGTPFDAAARGHVSVYRLPGRAPGTGHDSRGR